MYVAPICLCTELCFICIYFVLVCFTIFCGVFFFFFPIQCFGAADRQLTNIHVKPILILPSPEPNTPLET